MQITLEIWYDPVNLYTFIFSYGLPLWLKLVKNTPAVWETWVGKIPWRRERLPVQCSGLEVTV